MRKTKLFSLLVLLMTAVTGAVAQSQQPQSKLPTDTSGAYLISSVDDWNTFASEVIGGITGNDNPYTLNMPNADVVISATDIPTYTATFTTDAEWDEVYAYAWSGDDPDVTEILGEWPGTLIEATGGVYNLSFTSATVPEKICFSNGNSGLGNMTEDFDFVDGQAYQYTAPEPDTNTQIISLENGMDNWFSTNLDITLEDLQSALVEATGGETSITINSQDCGFSTYVPGTSTWRGTLTTLDVSRMYMITVESSCEIELEGMPVDPASYSVTIKPGYNWIGMTMSNKISLTDAFAGFAENGDQVISSTVTNTYERRRWGNQFTILEPGQGYIYYSAGSGDRTFVFPVSE